jgi:hypothetical protein
MWPFHSEVLFSNTTILSIRPLTSLRINEKYLFFMRATGSLVRKCTYFWPLIWDKIRFEFYNFDIFLQIRDLYSKALCYVVRRIASMLSSHLLHLISFLWLICSLGCPWVRIVLGRVCHRTNKWNSTPPCVASRPLTAAHTAPNSAQYEVGITWA